MCKNANNNMALICIHICKTTKQSSQKPGELVSIEVGFTAVSYSCLGQ